VNGVATRGETDRGGLAVGADSLCAGLSFGLKIATA
jgi:hypothetical protein